MLLVLTMQQRMRVRMSLRMSLRRALLLEQVMLRRRILVVVWLLRLRLRLRRALLWLHLLLWLSLGVVQQSAVAMMASLCLQGRNKSFYLQ